MQKANIGLMGLGVMGHMLALNMERHGYRVAGHDLDAEKVQAFGTKYPGKNLVACTTLDEFLAALERPRRIMMMVPAGKPVDSAIASLRTALKPGEVIIEGMKAAKASGAVTSFDLNYRAKLWNIWGGQERAQSVIRRIVENVDVLVGNEEDLQLGLGIPGPEAGSRSKLDPSAFFGMIDNVAGKFPQIKVVATTLREVHSTNHHSWGAVAWIDGKTYVSPTCELDIHDRVGGGDGFASGFFYGLLTSEPEQETVNLGWAHGALLTTFPGDTSMTTLEQVRAFAKGGSARIQR